MANCRSMQSIKIALDSLLRENIDAYAEMGAPEEDVWDRMQRESIVAVGWSTNSRTAFGTVARWPCNDAQASCCCLATSGAATWDEPAPRQQQISAPVPLTMTANCNANDLLPATAGYTHD